MTYRWPSCLGAVVVTLFFDPEVLRSGFGVKILIWSSEIRENCQRTFQRILMANFSREFFGLVFPRISGPQKCTPQTHAPKSSFFHDDFLLAGETNILGISIAWDKA